MICSHERSCSPETNNIHCRFPECVYGQRTKPPSRVPKDTEQAYERGKKAGIELAAMYHHIMARNCDAEGYASAATNATETRRWVQKKRWHERSKAAIETLVQPTSTD